ncbi:MAG: SDR family oxidoreductase [Pseudomonadota bacterium]
MTKDKSKNRSTDKAFQRRSALVTGGGKRVGRAIALALGEAGFNVGIHYNNSETDAAEVARQVRHFGVSSTIAKADLSKEKKTSTLIETVAADIGPISLLVNSASMFEDDSITSMTRESWDLHMETNLRAPLKLSQDFVAQAPEGVDNLIINLIDQRVLKLTPQFLSYTLSKTALFTLTKTLAQELGPQGIRVNGIGPGPTLRNKRQSEEDWQAQNAATILGHGATPDDIVGALLYLVDAMAVTGQMIAVDGGQHLAWETADVLVNE